MPIQQSREEEDERDSSRNKLQNSQSLDDGAPLKEEEDNAYIATTLLIVLSLSLTCYPCICFLCFGVCLKPSLINPSIRPSLILKAIIKSRGTTRPRP